MGKAPSRGAVWRVVFWGRGGAQRRGERTAAKGALYNWEGALSTREYALACGVCPPTAWRAGGRARAVHSRLRGLTAHTARVPAAPLEHRVSTVGGAAAKSTYGLIATAFVVL